MQNSFVVVLLISMPLHLKNSIAFVTIASCSISLWLNFLADIFSRKLKVMSLYQVSNLKQRPGFCPTSFPGSFVSHPKRSEGRKTLVQAGHVASKKVGGDKNTTGGRCNQVAVLCFLNALWKGKICPKI